MPKDISTAILFFSQSPIVEGAYKRLVQGKKARVKAAQLMNHGTLGKAFATGLPVISWDESKQVGSSFGARLAHGLEVVFEAGYDGIIVIGNDCPLLSTDDLVQAQRQLESGENVIGPDEEGGAYLIGITREDFECKSFKTLPWQKDALFVALTTYLNDPAQLSVKPDVDTAWMLRKMAFSGRMFGSLQRQLLTLINNGIRYFHAHHCALAESCYSTFTLRGPPA